GQAAGGKRTLFTHLQQAPQPQRPDRGQRAPVRALESGEREAERGEGLPAHLRRGRARTRERPIHLYTGAEQQRVALERTQFEGLDERVDRRGSRHGIARSLDGTPRERIVLARE